LLTPIELRQQEEDLSWWHALLNPGAQTRQNQLARDGALRRFNPDTGFFRILQPKDHIGEARGR
jgi:hypothetical protein